MRHVIHAQYLVCSPLYHEWNSTKLLHAGRNQAKICRRQFLSWFWGLQQWRKPHVRKIFAPATPSLPQPRSNIEIHAYYRSSHAHETLLDSPAPHFLVADPYKWNVDSHKDMSVTSLTMTAPEVRKWTQTLAGSKLEFLFRAYIPPTDNRFSQIVVSPQPFNNFLPTPRA